MGSDEYGDDSGIEKHEPDGALVPDSIAQRLFRAAVDFDSDLITQIVQTSIDKRGVALTWDRLVRPVWEHLGTKTDDLDGLALAEYHYIQRAFKVLAVSRKPRHAIFTECDA